MMPLILDLCAGSGAWSQPYVDAGYRVIRVTLPTDVRDWQDYMTENGEAINVHGILAGFPCTYFANSGARWPRTRQQMLEAISIMDACCRIVLACRSTLAWWCFENPIGKAKRFLGVPTMTFDPCEYGDPYTKKTLLWGEFNPPIKTPVLPSRGSMMHTMIRDAAQRAVTPSGFARAFFKANP